MGLEYDCLLISIRIPWNMLRVTKDRSNFKNNMRSRLQCKIAKTIQIIVNSIFPNPTPHLVRKAKHIEGDVSSSKNKNAW